MRDRKKRFDGRDRFTGAVAAAFVLWAGPAQSAAPYSRVYCTDDANGFGEFAGKVQSDGSLLFGLSLFYSDGQAFGLWGSAARQGNHWVFTDGLKDENPDAHCKVTIMLRPNGTPLLTRDRATSCTNEGGAGVDFGSVEFFPRSYVGPVKNELHDSETFNHLDPRCPTPSDWRTRRPLHRLTDGDKYVHYHRQRSR